MVRSNGGSVDNHFGEYAVMCAMDAKIKPEFYVVEAHMANGLDVMSRRFKEPGAAQRCFDRMVNEVKARRILEVRMWNKGTLLRKWDWFREENKV